VISFFEKGLIYLLKKIVSLFGDVSPKKNPWSRMRFNMC
jgi:hypothetical protein